MFLKQHDFKTFGVDVEKLLDIIVLSLQVSVAEHPVHADRLQLDVHRRTHSVRLLRVDWLRPTTQQPD